MNVFIGMDVSLASTAICVLGERGRIVKEAEVASEPEALVAFLRGLDHETAVVGLEAGPLSQWLHKELSDAGFTVMLMETRQVKGALKVMPIKTDRRDVFEARVRELAEGNAMLEAAVAPILRARTALRTELAQLEKLVRDLAAKDPACQLMMTMPGVGAVIA